VDSNVLLDVATNDPNWGEWSARTLAEVAEHAPLIINPIIYAEVSIGYSTIEALDAARYRSYFPGLEIIAPPTPAPARRPASSRTSPRAR
jgi:hypothetical protein